MFQRTLFPRIDLPLAKRVTFDRKIEHVLHLTNSHYALKLQKDRIIRVLDSQLSEVKTLRTSTTKSFTPQSTISPDFSTIATLFEDRLEIFDATGKRLHRLRFDRREADYCEGACRFTKDGTGLWAIRPYQRNDVLMYLDVASGTVLAEISLEQCYCSYTIEVHPRNDQILIWAGAGQDGSYFWSARATKSKIEVMYTNWLDRVLGNFNPIGSEYVSAPHPSATNDEDRVMVHSFPSGEKLRETPTSSELFQWETPQMRGDFEDAFDLHAYFLRHERIVAITYPTGRHLLLNAKTMQVIGELWPEGMEFVSYNQQGQEIIAPEGDDLFELETNISCWRPGPDGMLMEIRENSISLWDASKVP